MEVVEIAARNQRGCKKVSWILQMPDDIIRMLTDFLNRDLLSILALNYNTVN